MNLLETRLNTETIHLNTAQLAAVIGGSLGDPQQQSQFGNPGPAPISLIPTLSQTNNPGSASAPPSGSTGGSRLDFQGR